MSTPTVVKVALAVSMATVTSSRDQVMEEGALSPLTTHVKLAEFVFTAAVMSGCVTTPVGVVSVIECI